MFTLKTNISGNTFQKPSSDFFKLLIMLFIIKLYARLNIFKICFIIVMVIQPAFTCSNLTIETLKQGVKYVQS